MERRNYIKVIGASALLSQINLSRTLTKPSSERTLIKPKKLNPGDKVAVIAPASAVSSPDDMFKANEILKYFNLEAVFAKNLLKGSGYKTRTIEERIEDLHWAFEDSEIKAVFCIRGGYGSASLLNHIDYELIKNNPKVFCGYSDITAMHLAINKMSDLITYHGPVLLSSFDELTINSFKNIFFDNQIVSYKNPITKEIRNSFQTYTINEGSSEGELIGGNLSLLVSLFGTPYQPDFKNKILFIEDTGEEPYRVHRMLVQLELAGVLKTISGLIIGQCTDCNKNSGSTWDMSEMEAYFDILSKYKFPCFYGLLIGHTSKQFTLPIGINVKIDTTDNSLTLLDKPLVD